jgi:hypothetical protein
MFAPFQELDYFANAAIYARLQQNMSEWLAWRFVPSHMPDIMLQRLSRCARFKKKNCINGFFPYISIAATTVCSSKLL